MRTRRKVGIFCDKSAVLISGAIQEVMNQCVAPLADSDPDMQASNTFFITDGGERNTVAHPVLTDYRQRGNAQATNSTWVLLKVSGNSFADGGAMS